MLLSKIKEIKNGRVIVKDSKVRDAVRPGLVEIGKTLFWRGREGDVVAVNGNKIILDIDGEKYTVNASECENGTTGDSKTKDEITTHAYKGYTLEWDNENSKVPAKIISPKGKIIFTYSVRSEPTITGFSSKVDAHLSKTKDGYQEIHMQINKLQDELEGLEGEENTPYYKSLVKQIEQLEKKLETQDSKTKDKYDLVWQNDKYEVYEDENREFELVRKSDKSVVGQYATLQGAKLEASGSSKDAMPLIKRHLLRTDGGPGSGIKGHTTAEEPTQEKPAGKKEAPAVASSSHQAVREKHGWSASKKESPKELEMRSKEVMAKKSWLNEENREISKQKSQEYKAIKQARQQERINRLYQSSPDKTPIPEDHPYSKLGKTNAGVAAKLAAVVLNNNDDFASHGEGEHNRWGEDQVYEAADFLGLPTRGSAMGLVGRKIITEAKRLVKAEQGKAAVGDKKVKDGVAPELVDKLMDSYIGTAKVWNRKQVEKVLQILTAQGSIGTNTPFTVIIGKVDREIGQ